jgi:hypothetical protein
VLLVALAVPVEVVAATTTLLPGVTYERTRILSGGRPVVLHVVRTPPQGDLFKLRPVLSHGNVQGRQAVTGMQARLRAKATTVGVNGDFFKFRTGESSGVFLRDGVLSSPPNSGRSSLALRLDGLLAVDRLRLAGSWRAGAGGARPLRKVNRKVTTPSGVALFSRTWGSMTPRAIGGVEAVVTGIPRVTLDGELTGTVTAVARGGRTPIPPGGVVLQALGDE